MKKFLWLVFFIACSPQKERLGLEDKLGGVYLMGMNSEMPEVTLERDDLVLVRISATDFRLGTVEQVSDEVNYDPWPLVQDPLGTYKPPAGLSFDGARQLILKNRNSDKLELEMVYDDGLRADLVIEKVGAGSFRFFWKPVDASSVAYFKLRLVADSDEGFYGMGGVLDSVHQRGKRRAMQTELDLELESGNNEAHIPVPLLIGTRGWAIFVDSYLPGVFDVATQRPEIVEITYGTGTFSGQGLTFYLFSAPHPLDLLKPYYEVTGYPQPPAPWALGPWLWRDENESQQQVIDDVNTMRALDLAASAIWIDRPYASGVNTFDFDPVKFPDPPAMIKEIHDLGFRLALWHTPYIDEDDPATAALLQEAKSKGYFPPRTGIVANNWSAPMDFTNPEAYRWWQELIRRYAQLGVEGYKLDYAEDVVLGFSGARNVWQFYDGSDERTMHSLYQILYHKVYAETLPEDGGFLLCRAGAHRDQVLARVIWPGDLDADLVSHREVVEKNGERYVAVGGLRASMIYGLSLSASGYPWYGSDTGGYRHAPPDKETFTRWFEQTALSTVMQVGTNTNDVPWEFKPQNGFDQEMLDWYRVYARLHLRLWPHLWTYSKRIAQDGRPVARPLGLAWPELGVHPDDEYMLGEELLVAPVVDRGVRRRKVLFPTGGWSHWWNGQVFIGPDEKEVDAPLGELPLFQKQGSIVPLLRPTIDTLAPTTRPDMVDSFANDPGVLWLRVVLGNDPTAYVLFDGGKITANADGRKIELTVMEGEVFRQGWVFEIVSFGPEPVGVSQDGNALDQVQDLDKSSSGWTYNQQLGGTLFIKVSSAGHIQITR